MMISILPYSVVGLSDAAFSCATRETMQRAFSFTPFLLGRSLLMLLVVWLLGHLEELVGMVIIHVCCSPPLLTSQQTYVPVIRKNDMWVIGLTGASGTGPKTDEYYVCATLYSFLYLLK
jgi:hypothetical protein